MTETKPVTRTARYTEDDYVFLPVDQATTPPDGIIMHYRDYWWAVHPEKGLAFFNPRNRRGQRTHGRYGAPQANPHETISRRVSGYHPFPHEVRKIPSVFVPVNIGDYIRS
jgi:hypothetical protein